MKFASPTLLLLVGAVSFAAHSYIRGLQEYMVPPHLAQHPVAYYEDLVPERIAADLRDSLKKRGLLYTNNQDTQYYQVLREDVGEAEDMVNGGCPDPYKSPNKNRTKVRYTPQICYSVNTYTYTGICMHILQYV